MLVVLSCILSYVMQNNHDKKYRNIKAKKNKAVLVGMDNMCGLFRIGFKTK